MADSVIAVGQQAAYSIGNLPLDPSILRHFVIMPVVLFCAALGADSILWENYRKIALLSMALFVSRVLFILRFAAQALISENSPLPVFPYFCPLLNSSMFLPYLVTLFFPIVLSINYYLTSNGKKPISEIGWIVCSIIMAFCLFFSHMYWGVPVSRLNCRSILQDQDINTGSAIVDTMIHLGGIFMNARTLNRVSGAAFNVVFSLMIFSLVSIPMLIVSSFRLSIDPLAPWTTFLIYCNDVRGEILCVSLLIMIILFDSRAQWNVRKAWSRMFGRKKVSAEGFDAYQPLTV